MLGEETQNWGENVSCDLKKKYFTVIFLIRLQLLFI